MGKIILLLVLCLGAGFYFPQTRPMLLDTLAPVLNPGLNWMSRQEMAKIAGEMTTLSRQYQELPGKGREFQEWLNREFQGGAGIDPWGNPYTLKTWPDSVGIVSNGPDLEINTLDDILVTGKIQRQRRRQ